MTARNAQNSPAILTLEEFTERFSKRYRAEQSFREMVHSYMKLSGIRKAALSVAKALHIPWYGTETGRIITNYATIIYEGMFKLQRVESAIGEFKQTSGVLGSQAQAVGRLETAVQEAESELRVTEAERRAALQQADESYLAKTEGEEQAAQQAAGEVRRKTDEQEIVRGKLREFVVNSPLVKMSEHGTLTFDEERIMRRLEEVALDEIVEGIESEGSTGFMAKMRASYDGLIAYWAEVEDFSELPNVDWIQSAILSRTKGYRVPTFPYWVAGKPEDKAKARVSVDTAISLDVSGSMRENNRMVAARKTATAMVALMRRLNSRNETFLSVFSYEINPITTKDLRTIVPNGGTRTEYALDWMIQTLKDRGPSLAYLITDGAPNYLDATVKAARRFQDHPYIMLRIFLIDGDKETEENVRKFGSAAGLQTKVVPVRNYQLGGKVIADMSKAIGEMRGIAEF
ncbi:hypothetical protein HYV85_03500 [Candidatus Woesearchaeota archaeon]|nr:hypothetical protein [Candidatus Woesearchaeota archaeon]